MDADETEEILTSTESDSMSIPHMEGPQQLLWGMLAGNLERLTNRNRRGGAPSPLRCHRLQEHPN